MRHWNKGGHKLVCKPPLLCAHCTGEPKRIATHLCKVCNVARFCDDKACEARHDELQCRVLMNREVARVLAMLKNESSMMTPEQRIAKCHKLYARYGAHHYGCMRAYAFCKKTYEGNTAESMRVLFEKCLPWLRKHPNDAPLKERISVCNTLLQAKRGTLSEQERKLVSRDLELAQKELSQNKDSNVLRRVNVALERMQDVSEERKTLCRKQVVPMLEAFGASNWADETLWNTIAKLVPLEQSRWPREAECDDVEFLEESDMHSADDLFSDRFKLVLPRHATALRLLCGDQKEKNKPSPQHYTEPKQIAWKKFAVHIADDRLEHARDLSAEQKQRVDKLTQQHNTLVARFLYKRVDSAHFACFRTMHPEARQRRELYTHEYVEELARQLIRSATRLYRASNGTHRVIRVHQLGAVDGRLCFFLQRMLLGTQEALDELNGTQSSRTEDEFFDRIQFHLPSSEGSFELTLSCSDVQRVANCYPYTCASEETIAGALDEWKPDIVLCTWMPPDSDWTAELRMPERNVHEYFVIGSPDFQVSGKPWETWRESLLDGGEQQAHPSRVNGYSYEPMYALSRWQLCCLDNPSADLWHRSRTVRYFRMV